MMLLDCRLPLAGQAGRIAVRSARDARAAWRRSDTFLAPSIHSRNPGLSQPTVSRRRRTHLISSWFSHCSASNLSSSVAGISAAALGELSPSASQDLLFDTVEGMKGVPALWQGISVVRAHDMFSNCTTVIALTVSRRNSSRKSQRATVCRRILADG